MQVNFSIFCNLLTIILNIVSVSDSVASDGMFVSVLCSYCVSYQFVFFVPVSAFFHVLYRCRCVEVVGFLDSGFLQV